MKNKKKKSNKKRTGNLGKMILDRISKIMNNRNEINIQYYVEYVEQ